jgi:O-antigen ligase
MIPLFYFASAGNLWFQSVLANDPLASVGGSLVIASSENSVAIASVFIGLTLLAMLWKMKTVVVSCKQDTVFLSMLVLALASVLWSQFPKLSMIYSVIFVVDTVFGFYLYRRFGPEQILKLLRMIGWCCFAFSIVLAVFAPKYGVDNTGATQGGWRGMYPGKNPCAEMTVFLLSAAFFSPAVGILSRLLRFAYVASGVLIVLMTRSITGALLLSSLLAYVLGFAVLKRFHRRDKIFVFIAGAAAVVTVVAVGSLYFREITYLLGKDPTLTGRAGIWEAVMTSIMKHPLLGYGYMAFWHGLQGESSTVSLANHWIVPHAHNGLLEVWLELGGVGLLLIVYSLIRACKDICICFLRKTPLYVGWYACIIFLMVIYAIDEPAFLRFGLIWTLYVVACVGLASRSAEIKRGGIAWA